MPATNSLNASLSSQLLSLPEAERNDLIRALTKEQAQALLYDWEGMWARPAQLLPPGDWVVWLIKAGRGFGKTRVGAETVRLWAKSRRLVNLAGPTAADVRDVMVDGPSGIMAICPKDERPVWIKGDRTLRWPSGCKSLLFSADEPERFRGPQCEGFWADELAAWRYPDAWDQAMFGLRLGKKPQAIVTTTPRPTKLVKDLLAAPTTYVTHGSTYDNRANLSATFFGQVITKYEGTRLGRQELEAEVLDDNPRALFTLANIEANRRSKLPPLARIVVAIDPAVSTGEDSDDTGIVAVGKDFAYPPHFYPLDDETMQGKPNEWAIAAIALYKKREADRIVGEKNNGGDMIESTLRNIDANISYTGVTATRGKTIRAEPVSALYEQNRVHHVGVLSKLEDEMCQYDPSLGSDQKSPNRMDALVWAITELMDGSDGFLQFARQEAADLAKAGTVAPLPKAPTGEADHSRCECGSTIWSKLMNREVCFRCGKDRPPKE